MTTTPSIVSARLAVAAPSNPRPAREGEGRPVATAEDPDRTAQEFETVLGSVLTGLRTLAETEPGRLDPAATSST